MDLDRESLKRDIWALYRREHEALTSGQVAGMMDWGQDLLLEHTLDNGGVLVFPHAGVADCGHQIAAVVRACWECQADQVIVISVLHAFNDAMEKARIDVAQGVPPSHSEYWGIQGPGVADSRQEWIYDHALYSFRYFWNAEQQRRGKPGPQVLERYPYLAGGKPQDLPGIDELAKEIENAAVMSTADPFHHGIGYGTPANEAFPPDRAGLIKAGHVLEDGIRLLEAGDYWGYNEHCVTVKSDARDAGQVFRYLRGPMTGRVRDLAYTDAAELYQAPKPTWVAAALYEWTKEA
jgi:hypothetical protein